MLHTQATKQCHWVLKFDLSVVRKRTFADQMPPWHIGERGALIVASQGSEGNEEGARRRRGAGEEGERGKGQGGKGPWGFRGTR